MSEPAESTGGNPSGGDPKHVKEWLGVATAVLALLAWFGIHNWDELKAWFDRHSAHPPTTAQSESPSPSPTTRRAPSITRIPTRPATAETTPDPGCALAGGVIRSITANLAGTSDASAMAAEFRGYGTEFDNAADEADTSRVRIRIRTVASDARMIATDIDNRDLEAAKAMNKKLGSDLEELRQACS
ncbi:hypothetical protein [Amycolatopsis orientalis]|uniref:hypothetical protein n=1 Tax=Amycolatopsis orientalis TaxID=31958 RepID=UPI0003A639A6|nr:hypothetical protein [Amycolatopsis orientalis]